MDLTTPPAKSLRPRRSSAPASFTPRTRTATITQLTSTRMFTATPTRDLPIGSPLKARNSLWPGLPMRPVSSPRVTTCQSLPSTCTNCQWPQFTNMFFRLLPFTNTNFPLLPNRPGNSPELVTRSFKDISHKFRFRYSKTFYQFWWLTSVIGKVQCNLLQSSFVVCIISPLQTSSIWTT